MCEVKGFTILELMVTIAVAAILLIIGAPSLNSLYQSQRADMAARKIHQIVILARSHAVSTDQFVTVCNLKNKQCTTDWSSGITAFVDYNGNKTLDAGSDIKLKQIDGFDDDDKINAKPSSFQFRLDGTVNKGGTIAYCPKDYRNIPSKQVVISNSGRIRLRELNISKCE